MEQLCSEVHDGRKYCLSTSACGFRSLWAAKACMFTWQHASLVRLQPHYVCILGNSKCAVTTARHSHSTRQRLIGVKKDRSTPNPCHPARLSPYTCHSPFLAPLQKSHFASSAIPINRGIWLSGISGEGSACMEDSGSTLRFVFVEHKWG